MRSGEGNNESYAPRDLHFAERGIARTLLRLSAGRPPWQIANPEAALQVANRHTGKPLTGSQREAFLGVLKNKVSIITGGPGTGKTTLLRALLHALKRAGARPKQAAPTGRAAMNMIDATGMDAETVHLLLGRSDDGRGFRHGPDEPLDCDVMVVDEGSMMDVLLLHGLVSALPSHAALLLVGDNDQLEPVGPGRPFGDAIESGRIAVYRLTEIMRQAAGSRIITGCDAIRRGQVPKTSQNPAESDLLFYRVSDPNKVAATIVDLAARGIPKLLGIDALRDVQVLSPMNVRILGTTHLQPLLREAIDRTSGPEIRTRHGNFARGDKVLHVRNDYRIGVRNGEIGIIEGVEPRSGTVTVAYADRLVPYDRFAMEDLRHGYGVSVHKSQGSEYPAVIMPVVTEHAFMLRRRLLLTALSRGKQMTVMVGSEAALERAVANARDDSRHTNLKRLLMEG
jgi:exodeoxyribonuclease V alpha subunit